MAAVITRLARGMVAGAVGTLAMDLVWYRRYRAGGGEDGFVDWEFATGVSSFDEASAPGQFARKVTAAIGIDLPDQTAALATNAMHWITGIGYGAAHGLLQDRPRNLAVAGLLTGAGTFANSYATLGALGIYEPMWKYDRQTLAKDFTAHLTFGVATGLAYRLLESAGRRDNILLNGLLIRSVCLGRGPAPGSIVQWQRKPQRRPASA